MRQTGERTQLRRRLNLPDDQLIVLHAGSLAEWSGAQALLSSVATWPADMTLLLQLNQHRRNPFTQRFSELGHPRVILSESPLDDKAYETLLASVDAGIAFYVPDPSHRYIGDNLLHIGQASGKLAYYAKYGLPTLTSDQQGFHNLFAKYPFGAIAATAEDIRHVLLGLLQRRDSAAKEARRCFSEHLDFEVHWPEIRQRVLQGISS